MDDFEKRLQAVPGRKIPAAWKSAILAEAKAAGVESRRVEPRPQSSWAVFSAAFWPSPKAWAGLAAVWAIMFLLNRGAGTGLAVAKTVPPPSPELILAIQNQQRQLAELLHDFHTENQSPPSSDLKPRTESPAQPRAGMHQKRIIV
jgi:hypothetical protein